MDISTKENMKKYIVALIGPGIVLVALITSVLAGFGSKWEWWHFRDGFVILKYGVFIAIFGLATTSVVVFYFITESKNLMYVSFVAMAVSVFIIITPVRYSNKMQKYPMIHEITTDIGDPPLFTTLAPIRTGATNSAEYDVMHGDRLVQMENYNDIRTLLIKFDKKEGFDIAYKIAKDMGWDIVYSNRTEGAIEAIDTTFWFGFKDDVSVRIRRSGPENIKVDMRSLSRVGRGDAGKNAERVREFLSKVKKEIEKASRKKG